MPCNSGNSPIKPEVKSVLQIDAASYIFSLLIINSSEIIQPNFLIRCTLSKYVPNPLKKLIDFNSDTFLTKF